MNEDKVQLDAADDWLALRQLLQDRARDTLREIGPAPEALPGLERAVAQAVEAVLEMAAPNVQINGFDLPDPNAPPGVAEPEYAPLDEALLRRLQEVQAETDRVMVRVAEQRRVVPQQLVQHLRTRLEADAHAAAAMQAGLAGTPEALTALALPADLDETLTMLTGDAEALHALTKTLPPLAAKLQNVASVLDDLPRLQERSRQLLGPS